MGMDQFINISSYLRTAKELHKNEEPERGEGLKGVKTLRDFIPSLPGAGGGI